jgi:predicted XRE-type DNA-binding protein
MAGKRADSDAIGVLRELEDIKRLLLLALLRSGASQEEVAKALGVSQPSISRMFPGGTRTKTKTPRKRS